MIIAIDVDGVLALTIEEVISLINGDHGTSIRKEQIVHFHALDELVPPGVDWGSYFGKPGLYDKVEVDQDAKFLVDSLKSRSHRVVFATSVMYGNPGEKYGLLVRNGLAWGMADYIEVQDKSLIRADVLLDDYEGNLMNFVGRRYLLNQPWNYEAVGNFSRVHSLCHFLDVV